MNTRQINTGRRVTKYQDSLQKKLDGRDGKSLMQHITVYAWDLAMVLDRLEYLEAFADRMSGLSVELKKAAD